MATARRGRRVPSRAQRIARSPRVPSAVVLAYRLAARRIASQFAKRVRSALAGKLDEFALERRADAAPDDVLGSVLPAITSLREASASIPSRALKHSKSEFRRLGISLEKEPAIAGITADWRKESAKRFEKILERERETIIELLKDSENRTPDELDDRLEERFVVTQSKLETAAHDDVLTLNAKITQERQTAAGVTAYVWTTTGDERVRHTHAELDGKQFDWDDPPVTNEEGDTNHPGEDWNCRCVPFPVLDELDEATDEEAA